jgi:hypothetical protein
MSRENRKQTQSGDAVAWISNSLSGHAERQKTTLLELHEAGIKLDGNKAYDEMIRCVKASHGKRTAEWATDQVIELRVQDEFIKKAAQRICTPVKTASAIGRVSEDEVRVAKWRIIGDPKIVYCIKHSSANSPCTRGHHYVDMETGKSLGTHCQRCVSELSNKKGSHQLRRLLERAGKVKRSDSRTNDGKGRNGKSPSNVDMGKILTEMSGSTTTESPQWASTETALRDSLKDLPMTELRTIARSKGMEKMPRSKAEMVDAISKL